MRKNHRIPVIAALLGVICGALGVTGAEREERGTLAAGGDPASIRLPYTSPDGRVWQELYVIGGYHSIDSGCPAWGTADSKDIRMIGDEMGTLNVEYADGTSDRIPLVFGYTMWFRAHWLENVAPLKDGNSDPELIAALKNSLALFGAYEGSEACVLKVKLRAKPVKKISIADNKDKDGSPVFKSAFLTDGGVKTLSKGETTFSTGDAFFEGKAVDPDDPYPEEVKRNLEKIRRALYTYEEEYEEAPVFEIPAEFGGPAVTFSGNQFARIATGTVYTNVVNLASRVDEDGFFHTSYKDAPSWRYDGFGVWVENANSYYDAYYSRDGGRAIMSLIPYGYVKEAAASAGYANRCLMYFPENRIKFNGFDVPGHFTVMINKPMTYQEVLVPVAHWPTAYTQKDFGDDYKNLGNQETDGHGLLMMAVFSVWRANGSSASWVEENWEYINEGAKWIGWCFEHPDISLAKKGLLYAESEAGMKDYTLYCNVPCYLGLKGYAEMALVAGHTEEAEKWNALADGLRKAMIENLSGKDGWKVKSFGFFHDPVLTMMSDVYGYDVSDMDGELAELSFKTYGNDTGKAGEYFWYGAGGIGYHHSMLVQNALLCDNMADATVLMENLSRICYAPGLPEPYMVPEGVSVLAEEGIMRRQGDLGNLVQQAEALKCYSIAVGVSPVYRNVLKIMPRLPKGWTEEVYAMPLTNTKGLVDLKVTYPSDGVQTAQFRLKDTEGLGSVKLRLGPFPAENKFAAAQINGQDVPCEKTVSGDSAWVWVECASKNGEEQRVAVVYGDGKETVPGWPSEWSELSDKRAASNHSGNALPAGAVAAIAGGAAAAAVAVAAGVAAGIAVAKKKKENQDKTAG